MVGAYGRDESDRQIRCQVIVSIDIQSAEVRRTRYLGL